MNLWMSAATWLGSVAAQLPDTIVTKQIVAEPSMLDRVMSVASGLMTVSILVLTVALVPAAWNFRKSYQRVNQLLDRIEGDIRPIMRHASTIADNVNYISTAVRSDIQQVSRTIAMANEKLVHAVASTESRIKEFNALIDVAQEEAESAIVATASTLHGVAAGAAAYAARGRRQATEEDWEDLEPVSGGLRRAVEEERAPLEGGAGNFNDFWEESDGDDGPDSADDRREAPRVRPRGGHGREA
jgi:uncharacterized protein YoxC